MNTTHKRNNYWKRWGRRQRLADPLPDVICIVTLILILLMTGYLHIPMAV